MKHLLALLLLLPGLCAAQEKISHGRFEDVRLYIPQGAAQSFVLLLSGKEGWTPRMQTTAQELTRQNALVAGISTPMLYAELEKDGGDCVFPDGDLENLAHYLQGYAHLPTYYPPYLVGDGEGAALAYAMLAQAPANTFAGALSLSLCPKLALRKPVCEGEGLQLRQYKKGKAAQLLLPGKNQLQDPWTVLQPDQGLACDAAEASRFAGDIPGAKLVTLADADWQTAFADAYRELAQQQNAASLALPPKSLSDLPLIEVPAQGAGNTDQFAILISGDGGWAGLDKEVADALAARGIPVTGWDSLRYFWSARTPEGLAADLDRVLRYYTAHWKRPQALLIGYSQGANVLPFALNRLPAASKALVSQIVLMGLTARASFEFHVGNWVGEDEEGLLILPEMKKLTRAQTLCIHGEDEDDSLCPQVPGPNARGLQLPGGHHFDGDYDKLAAIILDPSRK